MKVNRLFHNHFVPITFLSVSVSLDFILHDFDLFLFLRLCDCVFGILLGGGGVIMGKAIANSFGIFVKPEEGGGANGSTNLGCD